MEVGELDVVGVVDAGMVDEAVDGVERHARAAHHAGAAVAVALLAAALLLLAVDGLQPHAVGLEDADHATDVVVGELLEAAGLAEKDHGLL